MTEQSSVSIKKVCADYAAIRALTNVNIDLPQGQRIAIIGPNGAGKSTLLKLITGLKKPSCGSIMICGMPIAKARRLNCVAYVPQESDIDWDFPISVKETVLSGRYGRLRTSSQGTFRNRLGNLFIPLLPPKFFPARHHQAAAQALQAVQLDNLASRAIGDLSGGQKKRVFLARSLAQAPRIMLLDEPLAGVDRQSESIILDLLSDFAANGNTVIMVTHDLPTAQKWADHVVLVNHTITASGPPQEMLTDEYLEKGYHRPENRQ